MMLNIPTLTLFVKGIEKQISKLVKAFVPQAFEVCSYSPARVISVPSVGTVRLLGNWAYNPKNSDVDRLVGPEMHRALFRSPDYWVSSLRNHPEDGPRDARRTPHDQQPVPVAILENQPEPEAVPSGPEIQ